VRIVKPAPGQESVWDYPRPPRVEAVTAHVTIELGGRIVADTTGTVRVLETSHPPVYYLPRDAFPPGILAPAPGHSFCEYKGLASYLSVGAEDGAAWFYPNPNHGYEILRDLVAVYPGRMQRCTVGDYVVTPQDGDFYGGWITPDIVGPFKGAPGTLGW
jgi:uncharacterized protein (DUF427 family)